MSKIAPTLKTEHVDIDGARYETTQFPAMRAYGLLTKLVKHIGPALGMISQMEDKSDLMLAAPAIGMALGNLTEQEAQKLLLDILACTTVDNAGTLVYLSSTDAINGFFSGKLGTMFKVVAHALKVNYADFFGDSSDPAETPGPASQGA